MNVLFSIGDRPGSAIYINRLLNYIDNNINVSIASYSKNKDWIDLSLLKESPSSSRKIVELFGFSGLPRVNYFATKGLIDYVCEFNPDIIISDGEPIVANIAKLLGIELWYCSSLHILDGTVIGKYDLKYHSKLLNTRKFLSQLPDPNKVFIYSYLGDINNSIQLKDGYNWVMPYYINAERHIGDIYNHGIGILQDDELSSTKNIIESIANYSFLDDFVHNNINDSNYIDSLRKSCYSVISGNTSAASDCVYNNIYSYIIPSINNPESLINASLLETYGLGLDLGDLSRIRRVDALNKIKNSISSKNKHISYIKTNNRYLHNYII